MKHFLGILLLTGSVALAQRVQVPPMSTHTLDNGLTVILMPYKKVPVVHFRLVARGGSADDPEGLEGVAAVATSLMREGTETRNTKEIANEIDFIGGSLFATASGDFSTVRCEVLKKDADKGLELLSDILLHPVFPSEELDRERKQRLASLESMKEEPGRIASVVFAKSLYGSHPYGKQSFGTSASLHAMDRENLVEYYRQTFVPNNCILAVVGDFSQQEMLEKITRAFGGWQRGSAQEKVIPFPIPVSGRKVLLVDKADVTQTQIRIGNVGVDIKNPDYFAIEIANTVFGSGFTSRLVEELRVKRSLTYGVGSGFSASLYGGSYSISTFTKNETLGEALDVVLEELKKYRQAGATAEEWKKAQNYVAGNFARSLQSPEALAARLTDIEFYGFPKDRLETYIQKLRSASLSDGKRVIQKYFLLDDLLFVLVAPAESAKHVVEKYGPVNVVHLKDAIE